ncbi:hypothetical protein BC835DRAFT_1305033 [Cytidiella melzeri]|nr:hypothetical protein BC835DRAFT_1305033 [Cytidiella melzeri]
MKDNQPNVFHLRAYCAIHDWEKELRSQLIKMPPMDVLRAKLNIPLERRATKDKPVCIIGAGTAGLYTAMILESLDIPCEIMEASDRVGGRVFTYHFGAPKRSDVPENYDNTYDYFDVGAMRFPDSPFMKRTFDLVKKRLQGIKLIDYHFDDAISKQTYHMFNGVRYQGPPNATHPDPYQVTSYVPLEFRSMKAVDALYKSALKRFRKFFVDYPNDLGKAVRLMVDAGDNYSLRTYMFHVMKIPHSVINYVETFNMSTGAYDRALTEIVLESLAFKWPTKEEFEEDAGQKDEGTEDKKKPDSEDIIQWKCFDKGSQELPLAMQRALTKTPIHFNLAATKISANENPDDITVTAAVQRAKAGAEPGSEDTSKADAAKPAFGKSAEEKVVDPSKTDLVEKPFSAVISTVPLPRLGLIDLKGCNINQNYGQWSAIRELQYGPSIKIGIRFSEPWWQKLEIGEKQVNLAGGQSSTDMPIRTTVYPSYPEGPIKSNVLIASYCWTQDAERLGAMMHGDGKADPELIELVFRDLADLHNVSVEYLKGLYQPGDYFAWNWTHDPLTMGAFAYFGPGQFRTLYPHMIAPAGHQKLFFAGEALSSCHATGRWVAGALDSSWRAVEQFLKSHNYPQDVLDNFHTLWGKSEFWEGTSEVPVIKPISQPGVFLPPAEPSQPELNVAFNSIAAKAVALPFFDLKWSNIEAAGEVEAPASVSADMMAYDEAIGGPVMEESESHLELHLRYAMALELGYI